MSALASAVSTSSASNVSQELPSYHFSAEEVQNDCQVQPSFHRRKISDIADPDLIDSSRLQILYQIGCSALSRHGRARSKRFLASCRQFIFAHQPCYAILSTFDPILAQCLPHSWTAVTAFIGLKDFLYLLHQFGLLSLPLTWLCLLPLIVPTAGYPQRFATFLDSIFHRKSPNHRIPGFGSSPTMLIAFFKISRWRLRYSFSFCSCRIFSNISSPLSCFPSSSPGFNCPRYALFHSVSV